MPISSCLPREEERTPGQLADPEVPVQISPVNDAENVWSGTHLRLQEWTGRRFTNACRRGGLLSRPSEIVSRVVAFQTKSAHCPDFVDSHGAAVKLRSFAA
jgi:hypothetical protein